MTGCITIVKHLSDIRKVLKKPVFSPILECNSGAPYTFFFCDSTCFTYPPHRKVMCFKYNNSGAGQSPYSQKIHALHFCGLRKVLCDVQMDKKGQLQNGFDRDVQLPVVD